MFWPYVTQQRDSLLRYVTFIEVQVRVRNTCFYRHMFCLY
jgi:hypothetical protein